MRVCIMCERELPKQRMIAHFIADHQTSLVLDFDGSMLDQLAPKKEKKKQ